MSSRAKWLVGIIIVFGVACLGYAYTRPVQVTTEKPVIKIGYVAPLTGNVAFLGQGVKSAAELALKDLQAKDTKYTYEVIFEDDAFDPKKTATAVNKLINVDHVDALVTVASAAGGVTSPVAQSAQVVHFGLASDPTIAKGEYNFLNWTPPQEEVQVYLTEMKKRNLKKIAVFGQQISGITATIEELKKQLAGTDIQVVSEDVSPFGTKDFHAAIAKAQAAQPDAYFISMFSPELELLTRQIREQGITTPLTAIESYELSDHPELFEGLWYVNAADPTPAFAAEYQAAYGKGPTILTPNSYDVLGLIAQAAETNPGTTKPSTKILAEKLGQIQGYRGALGENLRIDTEGLVVSKAVVRIIKDGKPQTVVQP